MRGIGKLYLVNVENSKRPQQSLSITLFQAASNAGVCGCTWFSVTMLLSHCIYYTLEKSTLFWLIPKSWLSRLPTVRLSRPLMPTLWLWVTIFCSVYPRLWKLRFTGSFWGWGRSQCAEYKKAAFYSALWYGPCLTPWFCSICTISLPLISP